MSVPKFIAPRLAEWARMVGQWLGAVPVTVKVIGLIVLPLIALGVASALYIRDRLGMLLQIHGAQSIQAQIFMTLTEQTIALLTLVAMLGVGLGIIFTRVLVHPLHELMRAMQRVQAGDLTIQVSRWAQDEIGTLQTEFNAMVLGLRESRAVRDRQQMELQDLARENARLVGELRTQNARLAQLLHHAIAAQETERKRLARELHDETGQSLTSILLRLKALQTETDLEVIHDRLNGLRYLTGQTLEEVRRLAMDLRPTALDDLGLVPAIRWFVQEWSKRSDLVVVFTPGANIERLPSDHEIILYRAVQEGLTNILRHAHARQASITLEQSAHTVWLTIADDGCGMSVDTVNRNGLGLDGMRERVALVGGRLQVDSAPDVGTRILIELPLGESV